PWSLELHTLAGRFPDGVAVDDGQGRLTFSELNARAHALARVLAEDGAGPGACVGIYLPNGRAAVWADYGATVGGVCLVHLNAAYTREEIRWSQRLTPMSHIVTDGAHADTVRDLGARLILCEDIAPLAEPSVLPAVPAGDWGRIIFS